MAKFFDLNTGAKIPFIGLGTWQAEPGVVGEAVVTAVKAGYRHIDCAAIYGNEKEIGVALKKLFEDGIVKREELFITSKLWLTEQAPEDVPVALDTTLADLQLSYVDLYLIHWPFRLKKGTRLTPDNVIESDIPSTWSAMEKLYDSGKARAIGVSNFSSKKLEDLIAVARVSPAVNQVECHPMWQQTKLRAVCNSKGVHFSGHQEQNGSKAMSSHIQLLPRLQKKWARLLGKSLCIGESKWATACFRRAPTKRESRRILTYLIGAYLVTCLLNSLK